MPTIGAGPRRLLAGILVALILPGLAAAAPQRIGKTFGLLLYGP